MLDIAIVPYQMKDRDGLEFLVDEEFEHLIRHKRIWTHKGMVMVQVYGNPRMHGSFQRDDVPVTMPLARFVLETYLMLTIPAEKQIRHRDLNNRNLLFSNLEIVQ